jgi:hypothetical protein
VAKCSCALTDACKICKLLGLMEDNGEQFSCSFSRDGSIVRGVMLIILDVVSIFLFSWFLKTSDESVGGNMSEDESRLLKSY